MEKNNNQELLFTAHQYKILIAGIITIAVGFLLMVGGGSDDPNVFSDAIFSFRRIRLAPTIVVLGFIICTYSIFAKQKNNKSNK